MAVRRPRLVDMDLVRVIGNRVPAEFKGRLGTIKGIRGADRTWTVVFSQKTRDWSVFYRHELERAKK